MNSSTSSESVQHNQAQSAESLLADRLVESMREQWRAGERPLSESIFSANPVLVRHPQEAIKVIYEEVCLREEYGEAVGESEWVSRFPQWSEEIHSILLCHQLVNPASKASRMPEEGDTVGPLRLIRELGRGALGRVFLAREDQLGCRLLVVKVSPRDMRESRLLSRMQHTHIAPLYFVHDDAERNITAFCMPYLGGATMEQIFAFLGSDSIATRTGKTLVETLDRFQSEPQDAELAEGPMRTLLGRMTYTQAVVWIGACLADALSHVHSRNLVHLDIKPSNVLLAADGQPMLLDFHLAREPVRSGDRPVERIGGTWEYMPMEQRHALQAVERGEPVPADLDRRADVYGLGMLMYCGLAGERPSAENPIARLKQINPAVTSGLADVVAKCLQREAKDRYQDMESVALDLKYHLSDRPLLGVSNRSMMERVLKWRRRHPQALLIGLLSVAFCLCLLGSLVLVWTSMQHRIQLAEQVLAENGREYFKSSPRDGTKLRDALASIDKLYGVEDLQKRIRAAIDHMEIEEEVDRMHRLAERIRFQDKLDSESTLPSSNLRDQVAKAWSHRERILETTRNSNDAMRTEQIRSELAELAVWLSQTFESFPNDDQDVAKADLNKSDGAQAILQQAEAALGDNMILKLARANPSEASSGASDQYRAWMKTLPPPNTPWERVALGRAWMKQSDFGRAIAMFDAASELQPQFFWPHFYKAVATYREGKLENSIHCWTTCIALAPESAECYLNRAICYEALGRYDRALRDDNLALQRNSKMHSAAVHRSYVHVKLGQLDMATRDLQLAQECGADTNSLELGEAWVLVARGEKSQATAKLQRVLERTPNHRGAMTLMREVSRLK